LLPPPHARDHRDSRVVAPASERLRYRVPCPLVVRGRDRAVGIAPGDVDPDARVVVELLRERGRARPVDPAEPRPALEPAGAARGAGARPRGGRGPPGAGGAGAPGRGTGPARGGGGRGGGAPLPPPARNPSKPWEAR